MKNLLFITVLFLSLYAQNSNATIKRVVLHAGYKSLYAELGSKYYYDGINAYMVVNLGDTIQFYRFYDSNAFNTTDPGILFHTIDLDITQSVSGATPVSYSWDNRTDETFNYVPNKLGKYFIYCDFHPQMFVRIQVFPSNTTTCVGTYIDGSKCRLVPQTTILGKIYNCNCVDSLTIPVITCPSGLIDGATCTGFIECTTCTGLVQNCSCTGIDSSPPGTNLAQSNRFKTEVEPQIFPNPAEDELQFTLDPYRKYRIEVYDINGNMVINDGANRVTSYTLSIKELKKGNYFAKVYYCACATPKVDCSKAIKTLKFIKK